MSEVGKTKLNYVEWRVVEKLQEDYRARTTEAAKAAVAPKLPADSRESLRQRAGDLAWRAKLLTDLIKRFREGSPQGLFAQTADDHIKQLRQDRTERAVSAAKSGEGWEKAEELERDIVDLIEMFGELNLNFRSEE